MRFSATSALAFATAVSGQTFTDCDPTKKQCPNDVGLPSSSFYSDFTQGSSANASWSAAAYSEITYGPNGAEFSIANDKQAPTMETNFAVFFGRIDVKMKASPGQGIISSIVLQSDDLDEIDWEFIGGNNGQVQSNFFGKGNTSSYDRVQYIPVTTPQDVWHTYSVDWTAERLQFLIDGNVVRTLSYNDPIANYGKNYPQTPSKLKLGSWCGGCSKSEGTVSWAGGKASFNGEPYVMYVDSVKINNYNPADAYEWSDRSGSWQSIKIINDGSVSQPTGGSSGGSSATGPSTSPPTTSHSVGQISVSDTPTTMATGTAKPGNMNTATLSGKNPGSTAGSGYGSGSGSEGGSSGPGPSNGGQAGSGSCERCTGDNGSGSWPGSTLTSVTVVGPTKGAGSYPTGTGSSPGAGSNGTVTSPVPSSPAEQTGNAASHLTVASGSLVSVVFGLLFL